MENARSISLGLGCELSHIRLLVMKSMLERKAHPTVDRILSGPAAVESDVVQGLCPYMFKRLLDEGVINAVGIDGKTMHFDGGLSSHGHFHCRQCGCIFDVPAGLLHYPDTGIIGNAPVGNAQVYYYGLCGRCGEALENGQ